MKTDLFDMIALIGLGLLTRGAGLVYGPFYWIVPGLGFLLLGFFGSKSTPRGR